MSQSQLLDRIPEGITLMQEDPARFEQTADHPLLSVPSGTVVDDLAGLAGCWGAYKTRSSYEDMYGVEPCMDHNGEFELYHFDFETGCLTITQLIRGVLNDVSGYDVLTEKRMDFVISGPDRITVQPRYITICDEYIPFGCQSGPVWDEASEIPVTLDDGAIRFGQSEDFQFIDEYGNVYCVPFLSQWVYLRLDCAQAGRQ
jgi:hypothetical protein